MCAILKSVLPNIFNKKSRPNRLFRFLLSSRQKITTLASTFHINFTNSQTFIRHIKGMASADYGARVKRVAKGKGD